MKTMRRRLLMLLAALPVMVLTAALLYWLGMERFEQDPRTFSESLQWAVETFTTTGYGDDGRWRHPALIGLTIGLQFLGVFFVFLIIPIYLIPVLEARFEVRLPRRADDLVDHVVIYRDGPAVATLMDRLEALERHFVVLEPDEGRARRLFEEGRRVVLGGLEGEALDGVGLLRAETLIANDDDHQNAAFVLAARQMGFGGEILALVDDPFHRQPMQLAGASVAFTPKHMLGAALAARASARISPRVSGIHDLGHVLQVDEVRVAADSELVGRSLREAQLGGRTGGTVIGQWNKGRLETPEAGELRIVADGILVTLGDRPSLDRLSSLAGGGKVPRQGRFVIGGFGEVGRKVVQLLHDAGEETTVIDRVASPGVDVVGDVLDEETLIAARLADAQGLILAVENDASALFGTVIAKKVAPALAVIARVNEAENVDRIHHAGADFALSVSQVSGQILAQRLLGEEAVAIDPQLEVRRRSSAGLVGRNPGELDLRRLTGCSVVAVERAGEVLVDFAPPFRFEAGDAVYVLGPDGVG
ncbi:MAG: NAD-binding protein [Acidobacteriota bacterium]